MNEPKTLSIKEIIEGSKLKLENKVKSFSRLKISYDEFISLLKIKGYETLLEHGQNRAFDIDEYNIPTIQLLYNHISLCDENINPNIGIIFKGNTGCGKSILAQTYCKVLAEITPGNKEYELMHSIHLADHIKDFGVSELAKLPLIIQDLGKEPLEVPVYGIKINPITHLLAVRAEYGAKTFGTMNMTIEKFNTRYFQFVGDRLKEHVNFIHLDGDSRRNNFIQENAK